MSERPADAIWLFLKDRGIPLDTAREWAEAMVLHLERDEGVLFHRPSCDRRWQELHDRLRLEGPVAIVREQTLMAVDAALREHLPLQWWATSGERDFGPCFYCHAPLSWRTFAGHVIERVRAAAVPSGGERIAGRVAVQ